jgi:hypothetical protein
LLEKCDLNVDHTTVWQWVQYYGPELEQGLRRHLKRRLGSRTNARAMSPCLPLEQRSFHEGTAAYSPNHPSSSPIPSSKLITRTDHPTSLAKSPVLNYLRP